LPAECEGEGYVVGYGRGGNGEWQAGGQIPKNVLVQELEAKSNGQTKESAQPKWQRVVAAVQQEAKGKSQRRRHRKGKGGPEHLWQQPRSTEEIAPSADLAVQENGQQE
jgi:hypothetical protein